DRALLTPFLPDGIELDLWNGQPLVSLVGLSIERTRLLGVRLPFFRRFEQVNVRFYVRRRVGDEWRRGVIFVKEFVPFKSLAVAARLLYSQNYEFALMRRRVETAGAESRDQRLAAKEHDLTDESSGHSSSEQGSASIVEYCWRCSGSWNRLGLRVTGPFRI